MDDFALTALDRFFVGLKVDPGDVFLDQGMRGRFADEDEMPVEGEDGLAQGLAGEEIVAEINRVEPGILLAVGREPPLRCGVLAVLFFRAILRSPSISKTMPISIAVTPQRFCQAQGVTVDQVHVQATPGLDRHAAYVVLSRHRERVQLPLRP